MKTFHYPSLSIVLRRRILSTLLPFLLIVVGVVVASCNIIEIVDVNRSDSTSSQTGIVFVTVTPRPELRLYEGQRSRPLPAPTATPTPAPYFKGANELGKVMVLEYHRLGYPETRYQRTPENFRADLQRLYENNYYPVNFIDLIRGLPHVPPGKKPVVLTFDDSDISQFRVLASNTIDADSVMGIILNFHDEHPVDWPPYATFFVLGDDTANYGKIFGQPRWAKAKLQFLIEMGMEVGSHTVNHVDLSVATAERIEWELAVSKHVIEEMVPGYTVQTLSVPYGGFPFTLEFLKAGNWGSYDYSYAGNVAAWGGPTVSPFDPSFEPYRVSRLEVTATSLDHWLTYFAQNPHEYYVSDGDPALLTYPQTAVAAE